MSKLLASMNLTILLALLLLASDADGHQRHNRHNKHGNHARHSKQSTDKQVLAKLKADKELWGVLSIPIRKMLNRSARGNFSDSVKDGNWARFYVKLLLLC